MHFTQETENNFIISDSQLEGYADFMSQHSLSENGYTLPTIQRKTNDAQPPPNSKDKQFSLYASINSPNFETSQDNNIFLIKANTPKKSEHGKAKLRQSQTTVSGSIIRYFHMKRFVNRLMRARYLFSKIREKHLEILDDAASSYNLKIFGQKQFNFRPLGIRQIPHMPSFTDKIETNLKRVISNAQQKLEHWDQQIKLFYPESSGKIIWDCILSLIRLYFIILIPLDITFQDQFLYSDDMYVLTVILTVSLMFDTILNLNTAYYQFGQVVLERSKIFHHVISKAYGCDVLSVLYLFIMIFLDWGSFGPNQSALLSGLLLFFCQYDNILKVMRQVEEVLNLSKISASVLELVKLIVLLIYILHVFTCIWYAAGRIGNLNQGFSWLEKYQLTNEIWSVRYLRSFYYCTVTMFTVGYGDMTPQTNLEYLLTILMIMVFSIQLPYSVNTVGSIIDQISKYSEQKLQKLRIINTYMAKKKINYSLQFRIREYLNYFWESENSQQSEEEAVIIQQLSENLRESLMIEANSMIINQCKFFSKNFSSQFKNALVKKIRKIVIQPENLVDYSSEVDSRHNCYLSFIESGEVEIVLNSKKDTVIGEIKSGEVFGLYPFITGQETKEFYRTVGFSQILILSKSDFMQIIREYPEDKEKFQELKDDLLFNSGENSLKLLDLSCSICNSLEHLLVNCPLLQLKVDREKTIKKYLYETNQVRQKIVRKRSKGAYQFHALNDIKVVTEICEFIQEDFWKETQIYDLGDTENPTASPKSSISSDQEHDEIIQNTIKSSQLNISQRMQRHTRVTQLLDLKNLKAGARKSSISPIIPLSSSQAFSDLPPIPQREKANSITSIQNQTSFNNQNTMSNQGSPNTPELQKSDTQIRSPNPNQVKSAFRKLATSKYASQDDVQHQKLEEKAKKVKVKFQKAFSFIKRLKVLGHGGGGVKDMKQQRQLTLTLQKQNLSLIQSRLNRKSRVLTEQENKKLDNLVLELNMQLSSKFYPLNDFDHMKDFKNYMIHNNFSALDMKLKQNPHLAIEISKLLKYLFYPFVYIKKYKRIEPLMEELQPKPISFATKIGAYKDVLKVRQKARKIIMNRRQVAPE